MNLNKRQAEAVHREKNVVVTAGAGSGKTSVLAMRFLRLIREGRAGIDNILTLTFTKKAAAEMYERIYNLLSEERDNETVRRALTHFEDAQISTIDSFCSRVVRNDPVRYGMPGNFTQDTDEAARFAEQEALDFILEKRDNGALRNCILHFNFERVWKGLFASLANEYFSLAEVHDFTLIAAEQKSTLGKALDKALADLREIEQECLDLGDTGYSSVRTGQELLAGCTDCFRSLKDDGRFSELADKAESFRLRKPGGKSGNEVLEIYKNLVERCAAVFSAMGLAARTLAGWDDLESLFDLCSEFQEVFLRRKREAGFLTFRDVSTMALDVLLHNHEVRRYYKETFRYIMIDEFQDNNRLQKDLLYLLAERMDLELDRIPRSDELEPGKLFFVGDEKQSIYRFRGADVSVIKELAGELSGEGTGSIILSKNYRSEPGLIDFFNVLFSRVMEGAAEPFEAEFSPLEPRGRELEQDPQIMLFYKPYEKDTDEEVLHSDDAEAFHLASYIRETVEKGGLQVSDGGTVRPVRYSDFAVLMRSTSNQIRYEKMFRLLGVPYVTQDVRALFLEAPVNDIYSALECAVYPEDRLALASFLRSPFVNISDEGFTRVLLQSGGAWTGETISGLSEDDRKRYAAGEEVIRELRSRVDKTGIVSLLYYLWYDRGYRYIVLRRPAYHGYLEYFEYLREYAYSADKNGMCTAMFLDQVRPRLGGYEKIAELSLLRGHVHGVQLLTIHKSKGLQFPVVVLANMGNAGRSGLGGEKPYYISESHGPAFYTTGSGTGRKNYFYEIARDEEKAKDLAELKRLLYVAATRARDHLIFSGCHNQNNRKREDVLLNMLLQAAGIDTEGPAEGQNGGLAVRIIGDVTEANLQEAEVSRKGVALSKAAEDYARAGTLEYTCRREEWTASELNELYAGELPEREAVQLPELQCDPIITARRLENVFGTYCHALIEYALGDEKLREPAVPPALSTLPPSELKTVLADARILADGFLKGPFLASLPENVTCHSEKLLLYRYNRAEGALYISAQPDLFIETDDENIIVDFKSDAYIRPGQYALQTAIYSRAAEGLNGRRSRAYLYYLRSGECVEMTSHEEELRSFLDGI